MSAVRMLGRTAHVWVPAALVVIAAQTALVPGDPVPTAGVGFLALALASSGLERWARRVFLAAAALTLPTLVGMSVAFGLGVEYRFEVFSIMIVWLTLAAVGALLARAFARG